MNTSAYLRHLAQGPKFLVEVALGLICVIASDRVAASLAIGTAILAAAYGWPVIGAAIVLYAVLMFISTMVQAVAG